MGLATLTQSLNVEKQHAADYVAFCAEYEKRVRDYTQQQARRRHSTSLLKQCDCTDGLN